ncbi:phosphatase PAP2 family protein [Tumebacillus permanentifrigoris]|uniref:Undecaprenyl-diphosphatase n=1 Tax=Tumebacillus permanentifrigoris TaxID=378543 RepID=A0A316D5R3_9BACL|nr:phosphatase PAP2 family protein [Tumebacillus permanentifrigoris]PWK09600.1 undecaprenyl-diphosphatase [Tumebacillus permanentifrigoris]
MTQIEILQAIQSIATPWLDKLMIGFSFVGDEEFYIATVPLIYYAVNKRLGVRLAIVLALSMFVNAWLKFLFQAPRPIGVEGVRNLYTSSAPGLSFPSGHSQGSATYWGYLAAVSRKMWFVALAGLLILSIMFSRLYLGVHWPIDVLGGLVFGLLFASALVWADAKFVARLSHNLKLGLGLLVPLALLAGYHETDGMKLAGFLLGGWVGYVVECKHVGMELPKRWTQRIVPSLVGLGVVFAVRMVGKAALPATGYSDLLCYALVGFTATMLVPWLLVKLSWYKGKSHIQ